MAESKDILPLTLLYGSPYWMLRKTKTKLYAMRNLSVCDKEEKIWLGMNECWKNKDWIQKWMTIQRKDMKGIKNCS